MSAKLNILKALTTLLEGTDYDGYSFAGRVFRGRRLMPVDDVENALSVLEAPRTEFGSGAGQFEQVKQFQWYLNVQGWPTEDVEHPSDPAYLMAEAVEERLNRIVAVSRAQDGLGRQNGLYPDDYLLGNRIAKFEMANSIVLPATEGLSKVAFFYIPVIVTLIRDPR